MTAEPWQNVVMVAFLTERGFAAGLALLGVFAVLFFGSLRRWRDLPDGAAVIAKITLASTIAATLVVSLFDAVLLLPTTALIAWLVIGATTGLRKSGREVSLTPRAWRTLAIAVILFSALSVVRSTAQSMAMSAVGKGGRMDGWIAGAKWDPGSYRINLRAAELHANRRQCTKARPYARQASDLFSVCCPAEADPAPLRWLSGYEFRVL